MTMKKIYLKRLVKILSLVLVVAAIVGVSQEYYMTNSSNTAIRLRGFYREDPKTLDVVVLGASEVYSGFNAPEFYKKTGVTSYPYAYEGNPVTLWKYELKEILRTQTPKLLIVEMNGAIYDEDMLYKEASIRYLADNMTLQKEKREMVSQYGTDDPLSYYFPIMKYHGEWLQPDRIKNAIAMLRIDLRGHSLLKGTLSHIKHAKYKDELTGYDPTAERDLNPNAERYLREFLDECKECGVENILFVRFPHRVTAEKSIRAFERFNRAARIVEEYGYEYVNLDDYCGEAGIEKPGDFYDTDHMMMSGQMKFTDFLAEYLQERYHLEPTQLTQKQKEEWDECVKYTDAFYSYYEDRKKDPDATEDDVIYEREETLQALKKYL